MAAGDKPTGRPVANSGGGSDRSNQPMMRTESFSSIETDGLAVR